MDFKLSKIGKLSVGIILVVIAATIIIYSVFARTATVEYYLYGTMIDSNTTYQCLVLKNSSDSIPNGDSPFYLITANENTNIKGENGESLTFYDLKSGMNLQVITDDNFDSKGTHIASQIQVEPS